MICIHYSHIVYVQWVIIVHMGTQLSSITLFNKDVKVSVMGQKGELVLHVMIEGMCKCSTILKECVP